MTTFADNDGRDWAVALTVGHLPELRGVGFVVDHFVHGGEPAGDDFSRVLGSALWVLCGRQALAAGVSPEEFGAGIDAAASASALGGALAEFMPEVADYRGLEFESVDGVTAEELGLDLERECWELAGCVGIDPRPLTYRQLFRMWKGRARLMWDQTAAVMAWASVRLAATPEYIDPAKLNPFRSTRPLPTPEQRARDQERMFRTLEAGLKSQFGG